MYVEARKSLVAWMRRQLVGPAGEGSLRTSPLDRYPTGVLHPVDPGLSGLDPAAAGREPTEVAFLDDQDEPAAPDGEADERPFAQPARRVRERVGTGTETGTRLGMENGVGAGTGIGQGLETAVHLDRLAEEWHDEARRCEFHKRQLAYKARDDERSADRPLPPRRQAPRPVGYPALDVQRGGLRYPEGP